MTMRFIIVLYAPLLLAQQSPVTASGQQQAPSQERASLAGRTLSLSGQPLRKANLTLIPAERKSSDPVKPYATASDAEGKFIFEAVEPGRYSLMAERPGYLRQFYGSRHTFMGPGTPLSLTAGQHMQDLTFQLTPQSSVSGKIVDDDGDAIGRTRVRAFRMAYRDGKRKPVAQSNVSSDENGEFKLSNLVPGKYFICSSAPMHFSSPTRSASADPKKARAPEEALIDTCYPNAIDLSGAMAIDVVPGRDTPALEIRLRKSTVVRVKGQIAGGFLGHDPQHLSISLQAVEVLSMFAGSQVDHNGNFEIANVRPGAYRLMAMDFESARQNLSNQRIEVGNEDLNDVIVNLVPPADLKGKVKFEGTPPSETPSLRVSIYGDFSYVDAPVDADGSFSLSNLSPDKYKLNLSGIPDGAYLRSVRLGDQEMSPDSVDLSGGVSGELQVLVRMAAGQVEGSVLDDKGQALAGSIVTLVPEPARPEQKYLYRQAATDQNGQFSWKDVNPGKYRIYAWDDLESGAQYDPDFLKPNESQGVRLNIDENGHEKLTLTRISSAAAGEAQARRE